MPGTRPSTGIHSTSPATTAANERKARSGDDDAWACTTGGIIDPTVMTVTKTIAVAGRRQRFSAASTSAGRVIHSRTS